MWHSSLSSESARAIAFSTLAADRERTRFRWYTLSGRQGRVIALDRSTGRLEELRRRITDSPLSDRIDIVQTNGEVTLDAIQDESLGAALLFDVLQHIADWRMLVSSLYRTLAPGALLLINPSLLSHPGQVDLDLLQSILTQAAFGVERTVRAQAAHYDRVREEEILVCRRS